MKRVLFGFILIIVFCINVEIYAQECEFNPQTGGLTTSFQIITAGIPSPPPLWVGPFDDIHVHQTTTQLMVGTPFQGGPGLRLSFGDDNTKFGQLALIQGNNINSTFATVGDLLLRAGCTAKDLVLLSQNSTSAIRFVTTYPPPPLAGIETERMTILNNGNVGIRDNNPKSPLQVGNVSIQHTTSTTDPVNGTWGSISYNNYWDANPKRLVDGPANGVGFIPSIPNGDQDGGIYFFSSPYGNTQTIVGHEADKRSSNFRLQPGALTLYTSKWNSGSGTTSYLDLFKYTFPTYNVSTGDEIPYSATFYIRDKVYIGTESLAAGVHPPFFPMGSYKLAVKGSILAQELVIDARAITWPDFVFDPGYNLQPLDELEKQLLSQRHLPGIPSAKDVEEKGLAIGDLQSKLLQKIEELTLYVIQLKKENDVLSNRIGQIERSK